MMLSIVSQILIAALAGLLLWAAVSDARNFIIPNRVAASIAVLWLGFAAQQMTAGVPFGTVATALAVGAGAFCAGFGLFMARAIGGGDVKLFAAVALWAGPSLIGSFVLVTFLCGGALALVCLAFRVVQKMTALPLPGMPTPGFGPALMGALKAEVPFGLAIAAGGLFVATQLFFGVSPR
jgi:prepilin peptidase CpaA